MKKIFFFAMTAAILFALNVASLIAYISIQCDGIKLAALIMGNIMVCAFSRRLYSIF